MSDNPSDEFFADGITEEIINALAKIELLKVTSRTSSFHFKNVNLPIKQIADQLAVSVILEGSVRRSGDVVRITAQLIETETDVHFWSETWDRKMDNIFEVQDEISLAIADKIREQFGHLELSDHLVFQKTTSTNAFEYGLMARFHKNKWTPDDIKLAEEYFQKSLALDPKHVDAIVGLSDTYSFMAMTGIMSFQDAWLKSNELVDQALELDPQNAEAYYQKANKAFFTECSFSNAFAYGSKAIHFKPNYVEAQQFLCFLYVLAGEFKTAKKHLDIALAIDPLSQETLFYKAYFDYMKGNYEAALDQLDDCLAVNPQSLPAHGVKPLCLNMLQKYEEAIHYFDDLDFEVNMGERTGHTAIAYQLKGDQQNADLLFEQLKEQAKSVDGFTSDSFVFTMHVLRNEFDEAFEWIENGLKNRASLLMLRFADPIIGPLHKDPRFKLYHEKIFALSPSNSTEQDRKKLLDDETAIELEKTLINHINEHQPYLDASLSLRSLATEIGIHPNQLSWLLNTKLGKSFNDFVNGYRVTKFKKLALDQTNDHITLIGLAYEAGFNSKTVFNTYFKKAEGQTPKAWLSTNK